MFSSCQDKERLANCCTVYCAASKWLYWQIDEADE